MVSPGLQPGTAAGSEAGLPLLYARRNQPPREISMEKLFLHMGVFLAFTALVYFVCMWFVRIEERERENKTRRR